tara:strand:- start:200 stop:439 length:240 start_codon:yes stop_codon:yes gene_type:complete
MSVEKLDEFMDIDTFITKLETELGCEDMGYIKCLESVIHIIEQLKLNEENIEKLEEENTSLKKALEYTKKNKVNEEDEV